MDFVLESNATNPSLALFDLHPEDRAGGSLPSLEYPSPLHREELLDSILQELPEFDDASAWLDLGDGIHDWPCDNDDRTIEHDEGPPLAADDEDPPIECDAKITQPEFSGCSIGSSVVGQEGGPLAENRAIGAGDPTDLAYTGDEETVPAKAGSALVLEDGKPAPVAIPRIEPQFKCGRCGRSFAREVKYEEHMAVHQTKLECKVGDCKSSFGEKRTLSRHQHAKHPRQFPSDLKVCHCGHSTSRSDHFIRHLRSCQRRKFKVVSRRQAHAPA